MDFTTLAPVTAQALKICIEIGVNMIVLGILVAVVWMSLTNSARWMIESTRKLNDVIHHRYDPRSD